MRVKIVLFILGSAPFRWMQSIYISFRIRSVSFYENEPVFVIGHWRSGTTHLHYLLSQDNQFSYLEAFQAFFFRVAFVSKTFMRPLLNYFMPSTRPQDNIKINASAPTEEEHRNCTSLRIFSWNSWLMISSISRICFTSFPRKYIMTAWTRNMHH